jgi:hypothetical protein
MGFPLGQSLTDPFRQQKLDGRLDAALVFRSRLCRRCSNDESASFVSFAFGHFNSFKILFGG